MPVTRNTNFIIDKKTLKQLRGGNAAERMLHRLHCVVLALGGVPVPQVSKLYGDSPRAIRYWVDQFKAEGTVALEEKTSGRTSRLEPWQIKRLRAFVAGQSEKGLRATGPVLASYIKTSFGVAFTARQCQRILAGL